MDYHIFCFGLIQLALKNQSYITLRCCICLVVLRAILDLTTSSIRYSTRCQCVTTIILTESIWYEKRHCSLHRPSITISNSLRCLTQVNIIVINDDSLQGEGLLTVLSMQSVPALSFKGSVIFPHHKIRQHTISCFPLHLLSAIFTSIINFCKRCNITNLLSIKLEQLPCIIYSPQYLFSCHLHLPINLFHSSPQLHFKPSKYFLHLFPISHVSDTYISMLHTKNLVNLHLK